MQVGADRFGPGQTCSVAAILFLVIATIDRLTGWELRLQVLYLIPVALVTWSVGRAWGIVIAALSIGVWLVMFRHINTYSRAFYYYWDAGAWFTTLVVFVLLLDRLRREIDARREVKPGQEVEADHPVSGAGQP